MLFSTRENLLSLYNAVNHSHYTDPKELEIVTLKNAVYMNMKNDQAFLLDMQLNLYEHQSTWNPNMPLRFLFYVAKEYQMLVRNQTLYASALVELPTPHFVVFYNGEKEREAEGLLKLSHSFMQKTEHPELELLVKVLNINLDMIGQKILTRQTFELLMARVINIKSFVKMFTTECEENMYVEIEDDFIEENNGKWNIHLGRKSMVTEYSEKNDTQSDFCDENRNDKYKKMTISQFGEHMLQKNKFYLNEMV